MKSLKVTECCSQEGAERGNIIKSLFADACNRDEVTACMPEDGTSKSCPDNCFIIYLKTHLHLWTKAKQDSHHDWILLWPGKWPTEWRGMRDFSPQALLDRMSFLDRSTAFLPWEFRQFTAFWDVKPNSQFCWPPVWKVHVFQMWLVY